MCGIVGISKFNDSVNEQEIKGIADVIAHRGPDGDGFWHKGGVAIGHRRLAIIDLDGGKQPISNENGTIWITFNGEIYNYLELRNFLQKKGHRFKTNSDTETIVHAYEHWGVDCVKHLRGMFAFAIVDENNSQIFIARDHLGIKPLVYYIDGRRLIFGSEIQAISSYPGLELSPDLVALDLYLYLQYIPAPYTAFTRIKKLPSAHYMVVGFNGKTTGPKRYWQIKYKVDQEKSEQDWLMELDEVLRQSVSAHLVSDVPFGAFLSGGVDSSTVVGYMSQLLNRPVKTFNISFSESEYDESPYAKQVSEFWHTDHTVEVVTPDAISLLPNLVKHYGEPFADSSAIPSYYVSRLARKQVTMSLSGDGGDEFFAGYDTYKLWLNKIGQSRTRWQEVLQKKSAYPESLDTWLGCVAYMPNFLRKDFWKQEYVGVLQEKPEIFAGLYANAADLDPINKVQYMDSQTYLPYDILVKMDIASMMNSLEVRTPIVDYKVAEFAATIPSRFNMRRINGQIEGKLLLKKLLAKNLGERFATRPKKGFAVPIGDWFAEKGALRGYLEDRLLDPSARLNSYFQPEAVKSTVRSASGGNKWQLLFLEEWLRQYNF